MKNFPESNMFDIQMVFFEKLDFGKKSADNKNV